MKRINRRKNSRYENKRNNNSTKVRVLKIKEMWTRKIIKNSKLYKYIKRNNNKKTQKGKITDSKVKNSYN